MLRNYLTIAWRNLRTRRAYTTINVLGLALGAGCAILIFTLITYQLSFDRFHPNADRIYRVVTTFHDDGVEYQSGVPQPFGAAFRNDFGFAEKSARVMSYKGAQLSLPQEPSAPKFVEDDGVAFAEPEFFEIFHFPLVQGDPRTALAEPNSALITQEIARKYFGTDNAVGKIIRYDNRTNFKVTGILADIPDNTDRRQEIYLSYANLKDKDAYFASDSSWGNVASGMHFFVLLKKGVRPQAVERAFLLMLKKYYTPEDAKGTEFSVQPLPDIHFDTLRDGNTDRKYLWALGCIGVFLIITACVNFINLATAQALRRAKEVGVRKVMGSLQQQLFWQFIAETAVITLASILLAYGIAYKGLPYANQLFRTHMTLDLTSNLGLSLFLPTLFIAVVFLSGSYPALVLARFKPVAALKSKLSQSSIGGFSLRRVLVVTQFAITQILIICMLVIAGQIHFSANADLGFTKDAIVLLPLPQPDPVKMHTLLSRISSVSGTQSATLCSQGPAANSNSLTSPRYDNRPKDEPWEINYKLADEHYVQTFGLHILAGRNLFPSDTAREFLVNETFVHRLGLSSPQDVIGQPLGLSGRTINGTIVGVVKDFYNNSFRHGIDPVCMTSIANRYRNCAVKVNLEDWNTTQAAFAKIWNQTYPDYVYSFQFLDERIARFYAQDRNLLQLIEGFACIAILIGCMGLYGLVSFMAAQKTKEIGVRKVLGADSFQIFWLFGKEFSLLLGMAFAIGAPLAAWAMSRYLRDYTYHIQIGWQIFALAIAATCFIAAVTVAGRSIKAVRANPIKSLRSE
jgi:putative ABC transport system permease protein